MSRRAQRTMRRLLFDGRWKEHYRQRLVARRLRRRATQQVEELRVLCESLDVDMETAESNTLLAVFRDGRLFVVSSCSSLVIWWAW